VSNAMKDEISACLATRINFMRVSFLRHIDGGLRAGTEENARGGAPPKHIFARARAQFFAMYLVYP